MDKKQFDFWYAVSNTDIVRLPESHIETFGSTIINYYLVAELMDNVNQVRIREGKIEASRPRIIAPTAYAKTVLEGFGEQAEHYVEFLKKNRDFIRFLEYGYNLKQESHKEYVVDDKLANVVEKVKGEVDSKNDPFAVVASGVDKPWDVCLVRIFWEVMKKSAPHNMREMNNYNLFSSDQSGIPLGVRQDIEEAFRDAAVDQGKLNSLANLLQRHNLFEEYQDRFFALCKKG